MQFSHHPALWQRFPELRAGVLHARGIRTGVDVDVGAAVARFQAMARGRLDAAGSESDLPEVNAWRRAFSSLGLKPTQYRCASESLLRRFRKEGALPAIHPLIDLCNAASIAYGIPVAALDVAKIAWPLQVRFAHGDEDYEAFGGEHERPEPGEVTFVDAANRAHARRWTHRQSGLSAVRDETAQVLIVCEALHADAARDVAALSQALGDAIAATWSVEVESKLLSAADPLFDFGSRTR
jgi:DNA/RNA-binding domain of Phe-tRNA-synthetase-like protein